MKIQKWIAKNLSLVAKITIVDKILASGHIHYSSCLFPSKTGYIQMEKMLWMFLWGKQRGDKGMALIAWDICSSPKDCGSLGITQGIKAQGVVLAGKWIVRAIQGGAPWQILVHHRILTDTHQLGVKGSYRLCDVMGGAATFMLAGSQILKQLWKAWQLEFIGGIGNGVMENPSIVMISEFQTLFITPLKCKGITLGDSWMICNSSKIVWDTISVVEWVRARIVMFRPLVQSSPAEARCVPAYRGKYSCTIGFNTCSEQPFPIPDFAPSQQRSFLLILELHKRSHLHRIRSDTLTACSSVVFSFTSGSTILTWDHSGGIRTISSATVDLGEDSVYPVQRRCLEAIGSAFRASNLENLPSIPAPNDNLLAHKNEGSCAESLLEIKEKLTYDLTRVGQFPGNCCEPENTVNHANEWFGRVHSEENSLGGQSLDSDLHSNDSMHHDLGTLVCVACGVWGFPCMTTVQLSEESTRNLLPADYTVIDKHFRMSGVGAVRCDVAPSTAASLFGHPTEVDIFGDYTASLVDTANPEASIKDVSALAMDIQVICSAHQPCLRMKSQITDSDISSKFINTNMPNAVSIDSASTMHALSALHVLAATYNDASDSDEVIQSKMEKLMEKVAMRKFYQEEHRHQGSVPAVSGSFSQKGNMSESATNIHQGLHARGSDSFEYGNQKEKPIIMRETPRSEGLPRNQSDDRMIQLADNVVRMSESSKGHSSLIISYIGEVENVNMELQNCIIMEAYQRLYKTTRSTWSMLLRNADEDDLAMIRIAIDEEEDAEFGMDWTAQLGASLQYSIKLSKPFLYSKKMPYNTVLDAVFCSSSMGNVSSLTASDGCISSSLKWQSRKSRSCCLPMGNGDSKQGKVSKHKKIRPELTS
eukprot:Gb_27022 [translate_table: standard]